MREETPIAIELARNPEPGHLVLGRYAVDVEAPEVVAAHLAFVDQPSDEADRAHFPHQGGIEADLVDAVRDLHRGARQLLATQRVDVHDDDVAGLAVIDQRKKCGIAHVAAVPIGLALDLHGLEQERQAGGGERAVGAHLVALEHLHFAGADVGRG